MRLNNKGTTVECAVIVDNEGFIDQVVISSNSMWSAARFVKAQAKKGRQLSAEKVSCHISLPVCQKLVKNTHARTMKQLSPEKAEKLHVLACEAVAKLCA